MMEPMDPKTLIDRVREIAAAAGREAMTFYGGDDAVERKADDSPLTRADRAAHAHITAALAALTPEIPVLSEEDAEHASPETRRGGTASGWWTRWTAPRSSSAAPASSP
jgi:3'(2'), 5'-bisphosphate nucleotidase